MKRVVQTINYITNNGPSRVLENIAYGIYEMNRINPEGCEYEMIVLTLFDQNDPKVVQRLRDRGIQVVELNYPKTIKNLIFKNNLIQQVQALRPDILHMHGIFSTILFTSSNLKCKKIETVHNHIYEDYRSNMGRVKGSLMAFLHITLLKKIDCPVFCGKSAYLPYKKALRRASYIRNGIDSRFYLENNITEMDLKKRAANIRTELGISDTDTVYLYAGAINHRKQVVELIRGFNQLLKEDEHLLILGDGDLMEEAKNAVQNSRIYLTGRKTNVYDYFTASDVYVSNSMAEGFSISVIEALEYGNLLMLSDIPSHKECFSIDDRMYIGETFHQNNIAEKKQRLETNLKNGKADKQTIRQFRERYLSCHAMAEQYARLYYSV